MCFLVTLATVSLSTTLCQTTRWFVGVSKLPVWHYIGRHLVFQELKVTIFGWEDAGKHWLINRWCTERINDARGFSLSDNNTTNFYYLTFFIPRAPNGGWAQQWWRPRCHGSSYQTTMWVHDVMASYEKKCSVASPSPFWKVKWVSTRSDRRSRTRKAAQTLSPHFSCTCFCVTENTSVSSGTKLFLRLI